MQFIDESKRAGTVYEHRGSNQVSAFKNAMIESFWSGASKPLVSLKNREEYYDINIAISKAIDELVLIFGSSFELDRKLEMMKGFEYAEGYAKHRLSEKLAEAICNCEKIPGRKTVSPFTGNTMYEIELPIIILPNLKELAKK